MDSIIILLTRDCNCDCKYCFEMHRHKSMNLNIAKDLVKYMLRENIKNVSFFGGEPLLNWSVLTFIVNYSKQIGANFRFSVITNGTLLDKDKIQFIKNNEISLAVSFDGLDHNEKRVLKSGISITNSVVNSLNLILNNGYIADITPVICNDHIEGFANDMIKLYEMGYTHIKPALNDKQTKWTEENFAELENEYRKILYYCLDKMLLGRKLEFDDFYPIIMMNWDKNIHPVNRCEFCDNNFMVDTNGDIYPCVHFINRKKNIVGNIYTGIDYSIIPHMKNTYSVSLYKKCATCPHLWYCHSTCACKNYTKSTHSISVNCMYIDMKMKLINDIINEIKTR